MTLCWDGKEVIWRHSFLTWDSGNHNMNSYNLMKKQYFIYRILNDCKQIKTRQPAFGAVLDNFLCII